MRSTCATLFLALAVLGCERSHVPVDAAVPPDAWRDASLEPGDARVGDDARPPVDAGVPCVVDGDCDDGLWCTGAELCRPLGLPTDARGCVALANHCPDGCNEIFDVCTGPCIGPPDADGDGHARIDCGGDDCDDADLATHPGGTEVCDGRDQNCDGYFDDGTGEHHYRDQDLDGYGDLSVDYGASCPVPGLITTGGDCNDLDEAVHPGAPEVCDHRDTDCDGSLAPGEDDDDDGWFGPFCPEPLDCDDTDPATSPTGNDECFDGIDQDCDGVLVDDADGDGVISEHCGGGDCDDFDASIGIVDADGDGASVCGLDCDDARPAIHVGAPDPCDTVDQDCDGRTDDQDGDGASIATATCDATLPSSYPDDDCDDEQPWRRGGAVELCDGIDDDCDDATPDSDALCLAGHACVGGACRQAVELESAEGLTCAVLEDRSVRCFGTSDRHDVRQYNGRWLPFEVAGLRARSVSVSGSATAATIDGRVASWGADGSLFLQDTAPGLRAAVGGWAGILTLHDDGTTRRNGVIVTGAEDADELGIGSGHICVRRDGAVLCWGDNAFGELGDGTTVAHADPRAVAGIDDATALVVLASGGCALRADGSTWCWGRNFGGWLRTDDTAAAVLAPSRADVPLGDRIAGSQNSMCVASASAIHCWAHSRGPGFYAPATGSPIGITFPIRDLAVASSHACAIAADGAVRCWGYGMERGVPLFTPEGLAAVTAAGL